MEALRASNTSLRNQNKEMDEAAIDLESQNKDLRKYSDWQRIILETIGTNGHDRQIISKLRAGESHQAIADWLVQENPEFRNLGRDSETHHDLLNVVKIYEAQCRDDGLHRAGSPGSSQINWTQVTSSPKLVSHLFDLYFTWVHPVHLLFGELEFKHDFRNNEEVYCSVPLVNAICAMACHLLDSEHVGDRRKSIDAATLREGFMKEARENLTPAAYSLMTSTQTFAVMYLVEISSGKARNAIGYLRSAVDNLQASGQGPQSDEVLELTMWGIQTLNTYAP